MLEVKGKAACNSMSNSVAAQTRKSSTMPKTDRMQAWDWSLYARDGDRKYLNESERQRVIAALDVLTERERLFVLTLIWSGARISEVLALTPASFQLDEGLAALRTLKRRRHHIREVPMPPAHIAALDRAFALTSMRFDPLSKNRRLWPFHRTTAWRLVKRVMRAAGLFGVRACPRGLRHAFGVATLQAHVPKNIRQKWLGHSRPETTDIYSAVCGPEERAFAAQFWRTSRSHRRSKSA
jgi:integrase